MRANDLAEECPVVALEDEARAVVAVVVRGGLPGVLVAGATGRPETVLAASDLVRCLVPGAIRADPCLARVLDEAGADEVTADMTRRAVRDLLPPGEADAPEVPGRATVVEVAEVMARHRTALVMVRDGDDVLGVVTATRVLTHVCSGRTAVRAGA